ncbi:MAG: DUF1080 domain-containing protein [Planctomycetes bacterium]|nr:DUF1080 domain-containing protein [Planctomycetota bacterium]
MKTLAVLLPLAAVLTGSPLVGQERKKPLTATLKAEVAAEVRGEEADVNVPPQGFAALFNGKDFAGWKVPEGDGGHWKVVDGVIDYDAASEAEGDKNLWTEKEYGDFVLMLDWRIKETTGLFAMPIVLSDGTHLKDATGEDIKLPLPNADSGVYLRGSSRSQVNIWCWPIGSGEVYGYRTQAQNPEVRAGVTPRLRADRRVGQWNKFVIVMVGDRLTVLLNGQTVLENAQLPDVPAKGALALQHHGGLRNGEYTPASSLVQFRNIYIKELPTAAAPAAKAVGQ